MTACQQDLPAVIYRMDATRLEAERSDFWKQHMQFFQEESASAFWERDLRFIRLTESTRKAKSFEQGWDGYEAPTPSDASVTRTLQVLSKVRESKLTPYSVLPSADGGVGISFRGNAGKRAVLELLNDGTSSYTFYGKQHPTESAEFDSNTELPRILQLLEEYL